MSKVCETCPNKERLFCRESHILEEDIPEIFKTHYLKEYTIKNSIKTKKGVDELYNFLLIEKRKGQYLAISFCNFPCSFCADCNLKHHMEKGYVLCSNRKLVRCIGLLGIQPKNTEENKAYILLKK
jgi:predicted metal-binding protein